MQQPYIVWIHPNHRLSSDPDAECVISDSPENAATSYTQKHIAQLATPRAWEATLLVVARADGSSVLLVGTHVSVDTTDAVPVKLTQPA